MVWKALRDGFDPYEESPESPLFDARVTGKTRELLRERLGGPRWRVAEHVRSRWVRGVGGCIEEERGKRGRSPTFMASMIQHPPSNHHHHHHHTPATLA